MSGYTKEELEQGLADDGLDVILAINVDVEKVIERIHRNVVNGTLKISLESLYELGACMDDALADCLGKEWKRFEAVGSASYPVQMPELKLPSEVLKARFRKPVTNPATIAEIEAANENASEATI
jgi:hypothetical protein